MTHDANIKTLKWEYYNDGSKVKNWLVDGDQPEGCVQFAYQQQNGRVSNLL